MKLTTLFVLILCTQYAKSQQKWIPKNLVQVFNNRTSEATNYIFEKGSKLKQFLMGNIDNVITYSGLKRSSNRKINQMPNDEFTGRILRSANNVDCDIKDPADQLNTPQLIALHGYPAESHTIITEDGYILTIHRIPYSKKNPKKLIPKKTVLLHHGLLGSSADWILTGPEKSLAYILSDDGYDVWMANARGNTYSRAHVSRTVDTYEFWNFTFHEVSQHDLPAVIDFITNMKGHEEKIIYIGHSMGTTVLFSLLSTRTHYNKVLKAGLGLAPVAYMSDVQSPLRMLSRFADNLQYLMKLLGAYDFLPQSAVLRWLSKYVCEFNNYEEAICENSIFVLCGFDSKQFNKTLLPIILGHLPAGASTKTLVHYAQEIRNGGRFQLFDYGAAGNLRQYGTASPPEYQVKNITLPIALFSSDNDWLASIKDVNKLYEQLSNPVEHYVVPYKQFNHLDFLWAMDAPKLLYGKVLSVLESLENNNIDNSIHYELDRV